jgi:predicted Rossmann-fold nucleotide-binding protein
MRSSRCPAGVGTMEELFEVWSWARLGLHSKPCGLLNVDGYFDSLRTRTDQMVTEGFLEPEYRETLLIEKQPNVLLDQLATNVPPGRWNGTESLATDDCSTGSST